MYFHVFYTIVSELNSAVLIQTKNVSFVNETNIMLPFHLAITFEALSL